MKEEKAHPSPAAPASSDGYGSGLSLAASRQRRRLRIARRAAMGASRAASRELTSKMSVTSEAEETARPDLVSESVEGVEESALAGARTIGRFAKRRARAAAAKAARAYRAGTPSAAAPSGASPVDPIAGTRVHMAREPGTEGAIRCGKRPGGRFRGAKRRVARTWTLKVSPAAVPTAPAAATAIGTARPNARRVPRLRPKRALAAIAAACGSLLLPVVLVFALALVAPLAGGVAFGSAGASGGGTGTLAGNEQAIAAYLLAKQMNPVQIAATIGNMCKESGCRTDLVNPASGAYGICQWLDGRKQGLFQFCEAAGVATSDLQAQLDFFWEEHTMVRGGGWLSRSDREAFEACTADDRLEEAVTIFARKFERCGESEMDLPYRLQNAERVLASLRAGNGPEYTASDDVARAIADSAYKVTSPGLGLCAWWVSDVYETAGCGSVSGNACDMYWNFCKSSDIADLKVGMIVAVPTHPHTNAGVKYGHVGVYVGDGIIRHNIGPIESWKLEEWIAYYGATSEVRWGYPPGVTGK